MSFIIPKTFFLFFLVTISLLHEHPWSSRNTVKAIMEINLCHTCINYTGNNIMRLMHGGLLHREIMDRERRCASCNSFLWCGLRIIALMLFDVQRSTSHIIWGCLLAIKASFVIWRPFYLSFMKGTTKNIVWFNLGGVKPF